VRTELGVLIAVGVGGLVLQPQSGATMATRSCRGRRRGATANAGGRKRRRQRWTSLGL
jgi:hypothetical protein